MTKPGEKAHFNCVDCGLSTLALREFYMVKNPVWEAGGMSITEHDGMLCIGCLEQRLGRDLTPEDFANVPLNDVFLEGSPILPIVHRRSLRLQHRMGKITLLTYALRLSMAPITGDI